MRAVQQASLLTDRGFAGDRASSRRGGSRQVSLVQAEHLAAVAALLRREAIDPACLRRNLVVSGISLRALMKRRFRIGDALLEGSAECHPCSKLEEALGEGGYNAMRGHGGILARVIEGGLVQIGSRVVFQARADDP
jgi:MOSC domain-containing protein YiiM